MSQKQPTFADYLVIAITPALIMLLVGSLVFFLLTAFFDGQYEGRVRYIFSLFIFAAVLIGRISIEDSQEQAALFGIPLAIATWLALGRFCETSSLVTILMIAITWWSAHKLTWDCTVVDEAEEAESGGLLQSAGFEAEQATQESPDQLLERDLGTDRDLDSKQPNSLTDLWQRWKENRKKPHSPGVWVIYFALATLPLFGVGQWAIPAADLDARRSAFHCLLVYVASAMALLGTTSFLGIRRYLRQRKLEMPVEMAITWAGSVAAIIFLMLLGASFLPRPKPAYSLSRLVGSRDIDRPSDFSVLKTDGVDSSDVDAHDGVSSQTSNRTTDQSSSDKSPSGDGKQSAESSDNPRQGPSNSQGNSEQSNQQPFNDAGGPPPADGEQSGVPVQDEASEDNTGTRRSGENQQSSHDRNRSSGSRQESTAEPEHDSGDRSPPEALNQDRPESSKQESLKPRQQPDRGVSAPPRSPRQWLRPLFDSLGGGVAALLRFLYWLLVIVAVSYFCLRYAGAILTAIKAFWSDLSGLFGRRDAPDETVVAETEVESEPQQRPFASFTDPMQSGTSMNDRELVRYTFLALEAWAHEKNCGRTIDETPVEFARRLAHSFPRIKEATAYVVQLYDRMAYAKSTPRLARDRVGQLWKFMRAST